MPTIAPDRAHSRRLRFCSFGCDISIDFVDDEVESIVGPQLLQNAGGAAAGVRMRFRVDEAEGDHSYKLLRDGVLLRHADSSALLVQAAVQEVEWAIAEESPTMSFVHAGVVSIEGLAMVLPGRSGAGKTTLVEALLRRGATYFSDEYAVIDADGRVHPYHRPLHMKAGTQLRLVDPSELTERIAVSPAQVALVIFVHRDLAPQADRPLSLLRPAETAMGLLQNAPAARRNPTRLLSAFGAVTSTAAGWSAVRRDASEFADRLLELAST